MNRSLLLLVQIGRFCLAVAGASAVAVLAQQPALPVSPANGEGPGDQPAPIVLTPFVVRERSGRGLMADRLDDYRPMEFAGALDLARSPDDALPFAVYGREQMARSGAVTLEDFLRRELLDATGRTGAGQAGGGFAALTSGSGLQLRGYAADETVVLINGRRLPESLTSGPNAQPQSPDVNFIPLSLVERVEVLPISASALYSGNPVGGVINIVLRPDADITEVSANYSNALGSFDASQRTASLLHSRLLLDGKLRLRLNATITAIDPPTEAELGYIRARLRGAPIAVARVYGATPNVRSASGAPLFGAGSESFTSVAPGWDGTQTAAEYATRAGVANRDLLSAPRGLANTPASENFPYGQRQRGESFFASANYDLCSFLQLAVDGMMSRMNVTRGYDVLAAELQLAADSPLNPFGQAVRVNVNDLAPLLGEDYSRAQREFSSLVASAVIKLPADWRVTLDTQRGRQLTKYRGLAGASPARWQQLVDRGIYQPLRDTQVFAPPPEFYERVLIYAGGRDQTVTVGDYETWDSALRIKNTSLRLPTGTAAVNGGGDFRLTQLKSYTDEQRFGDGSLAAVPVHWTGRTLQRLSVFGEVQAPLVPMSWLPFWLRSVEADVAARYTIADTTQEANVAPTGGLKLGLPGGFALRGSVATSNRLPTPIMNQKRSLAPPVRALSAGGVNYVSIFDPVRGETYGVRAGDALNPDLRPESAVTKSVGVLWERGGTHRWRVAIDLVDTQKSGELIYLDPQTAVNLENLFANRVARAPLAPGDSAAAGYVTSVLTGNFNLAWRHSQNVNTTVDYAWTECFGGVLDVYARWIEFQRYERQLLPSSPMVDQLRAPDGTSGGLLRNRANVGAGWTGCGYGLRLDAQFYDARKLPMIEWASQGASEIDPYLQFDATVQKNLSSWLGWRGRRGRLVGQLRVDNLFNAAPSFYANAPSGAGVQVYGDWRRQTYSLSLRATF
ncbi:MAG TPA: TonB-dependent receptor plug domain-containing protein [Opitutus sp.]|nr:TonB-dependent receptor plug domain-containing protein [Opitutus sp.]